MAKIRVHELAKELGMSSQALLAYLKRKGEFVKTASSTIEAPVIRELRKNPPPGAKPQWLDSHQSTSQANPFAAPPFRARTSQSSAPPRPGGPPFMPPPSARGRRPSLDDPVRRAAAELLGIPEHEVKMRPQRRGPTTGHTAVDAWLLSFIPPEEKREWMRHGIGEHELHIAKQWMQVGMGPKDLAMILPNGRDALWRLRSGEAAESVAQRVRESRGA